MGKSKKYARVQSTNVDEDSAALTPQVVEEDKPLLSSELPASGSATEAVVIDASLALGADLAVEAGKPSLSSELLASDSEVVEEEEQSVSSTPSDPATKTAEKANRVSGFSAFFDKMPGLPEISISRDRVKEMGPILMGASALMIGMLGVASLPPVQTALPFLLVLTAVNPLLIGVLASAFLIGAGLVFFSGDTQDVSMHAEEKPDPLLQPEI